jgi:hypothetical protein
MGSGSDESICWIFSNCSYTSLSLFQNYCNCNTQLLRSPHYCNTLNKVFNTIELPWGLLYDFLNSPIVFPLVKVKVTLRLEGYRQSVILALSSLRPNTRNFFQLNSSGNIPYVTSSPTRRWVCLLWICLAYRQVYISHIKHVVEDFFLLYYTQVLCQYGLYRADHPYPTYLMLQRHLSHLNGYKLDHH